MACAERPQGSLSRADAGARAEGIAAKFLEARGLVIVDRNFRSQSFGGAGASITAAKCARLTAAARAYLGRLGAEPPCRFDAVLLDSLDPARIVWERDILSG